MIILSSHHTYTPKSSETQHESQLPDKEYLKVY